MGAAGLVPVMLYINVRKAGALDSLETGATTDSFARKCSRAGCDPSSDVATRRHLRPHGEKGRSATSLLPLREKVDAEAGRMRGSPAQYE